MLNTIGVFLPTIDAVTLLTWLRSRDVDVPSCTLENMSVSLLLSVPYVVI